MLQVIIGALALPVFKRLLAGLGIGIITYGGSQLLVGQIIDMVNANLGQSMGNVLQIVSLFGVPDALGIYLGALSTVASMDAFKKFGFL